MILEVSWDDLGTLLLCSHNFMVTTLGLCVNWPLDEGPRPRKGKMRCPLHINAYNGIILEGNTNGP